MAEKEYIERDMYYQKINGLSKGGCGDYPLYCLAINDCMNVLNEMPAADVAPVRHGRWKRELMSPKIGLYGYICSNCNKLIYVGIGRYMAYCGNCGAKMDGGNLNGS